MAGPVFDVGFVSSIQAQGVEDQVGDGFDVFFNAAANVVRLADLALFLALGRWPGSGRQRGATRGGSDWIVQRHLLAGEQADDKEGMTFSGN